jgi:hypothetical protein
MREVQENVRTPVEEFSTGLDSLSEHGDLPLCGARFESFVAPFSYHATASSSPVAHDPRLLVLPRSS